MKLIGFKEQKIINLDNVSNIYIEDEGKKKVIFNMNYSVKIFNEKFTPDYVYWFYETQDELDTIINIIEQNLGDEWMLPLGSIQRYINTKFIASITLNEPNRIILNLNFNITHPKNIDKLTSNFIFLDFVNKEEYTKTKDFFINQTKY